MSFVILEWNQASGQPSLAPGTDLYDTADEARELAKDMAAAAAPRRERYTVHDVDDDPVDGW